VNFIIYTERVSKYLKGECNGEFKKWESKLCNSKRVFGRFEVRV